MNWQYIQDHWDWAGHVLEALCIAIVVAILFRSFLRWPVASIAGLAFGAGHFHGREKRDYEISVAMPPPHLEGYYFWNWNWDQTTDFWPVAIVCGGLMLLIARAR